MARDSRTLLVEIVGDDRQLSRTFKSATAESQKFGRNMSSTFAVAGRGSSGLARQVAGVAGAYVGLRAVTGFLSDSVDAASNLAEQTNKVRVVFGSSGREITRWGTTTATALGIANDEALEAAGTFGNLFRTVGLANDENARLSRNLVKLAADLASFNNADPSEVLLALRSGLIGEAEPMRRFGVLLSETRVQQEAMRETGKRNVKQLTDQEKVLARYNLILQDTSSAQGDFAKTADSQANASRGLRAIFRDTEAVLGKALLPTINNVTKALRDWLRDPQNQKRIQEDTEKTVGFFGKLAHVGGQVASGFKDLYDVGHGVGSALERVNAQMNTYLERIYKATPATRALTNEQIRLAGVANAQRPRSGEDVGLRGAGARGNVFPTADPTRVGGGRRGMSLQGQMNLLETRLAKALTTISDADDRALLVQERHLIKRQLAATKDWQKRRQLYQDLGRVQDQITSIDEEHRQREEDQRQKEIDAEQRRRDTHRAAVRAARARWQERLSELRDAASQVREEFGALFAGPLLNPSDDMRKRTLGVPALSAGQLVGDFRAQTRAYVAFNNDLARLSRRGAPSGLVQQLRGLGLGGAEQVHALAMASGSTLRNLFRSFQQREKIVQQIAHADVHARQVNIHVSGSRVGVTAATQRRGRQAGVPSSIGSYIGG